MARFYRAGFLITSLLIILSACKPVGQNDTSLKPAPAADRFDNAYSIPGWNQLLPFDAIRPVYDPVFISPEGAKFQGSELIMGVAWEGEAKAYPVTVLRGREMVNDDLAGIPYLVSW